MFKRKSSAELRDEVSVLRAELASLAEVSEGDGLGEDDQKRFDALVTEGDDNPITVAEAKLTQAEAVEAKILENLAEQKAAANATAPTVGVAKEPQADAKPEVKLAGQKSRHFADERQAVASAHWLASTITEGAERVSHLEAAAKFGGEYFAAQSIGTDGKGGHLVPTPLATEIIKQRDAVAVAPQLCRQFSMNAETLKFNRETGDVAIQYPGESTAITDTDVDWTPHTLTVVKRAAMVKMSREFMADINVGAVDEIVDNMAYRFAYALDNEFINGDGSGTYGGETGLIGAVTQDAQADSGETTVAGLDLEDYVAAKQALPHKFQQGASWLFSPEAWYQLELLLMNAGGAATAEFASGLSGSRTFMGKPVYLSDLFPAEAADAYVGFYGNFREAVACGDRNDMTISTSAERFFDTDDVAVRGTHRYDLLVFNPAAYVGLQLASS